MLYLDLSFNSIKDDGIYSLASSLRQLRKLKRLAIDLMENDFSEEAGVEFRKEINEIIFLEIKIPGNCFDNLPYRFILILLLFLFRTAILSIFTAVVVLSAFSFLVILLTIFSI